MAYDLSGKVKLVQEPQAFGSGFTKRELGVTVEDEKYPHEMCLEFVQNPGLINSLAIAGFLTVMEGGTVHYLLKLAAEVINIPIAEGVGDFTDLERAVTKEFTGAPYSVSDSELSGCFAGKGGEAAVEL